MTAPLPDPRLVLTAIDTYMEIAYEAAPPEEVAKRISSLREAGSEALFELPWVERTESDSGPRFCLRLGNAKYPFMKLTVEPCPDRSGYLFKADTHDRHICPPPDSDEHPAFVALMAFNEGLALAIDRAWEQSDVPTFKAWLKADLLRRSRGADQ